MVSVLEAGFVAGLGLFQLFILLDRQVQKKNQVNTNPLELVTWPSIVF